MRLLHGTLETAGAAFITLEQVLLYSFFLLFQSQKKGKRLTKKYIARDNDKEADQAGGGGERGMEQYDMFRVPNMLLPLRLQF